jgi:guanylate kinase
VSAGALFVVVAPSGAGKTSLVAALLREEPSLTLSVSFTTRSPRPGEVDGRDYHFVSRERFEAMIAAGDFLEHANVYGNLYGTARSAVAAQLDAGEDVVLEIDWQGARQVRLLFARMVGIFILPPSLATLQERLTARGKDSPEVIARRLAAAREDISHVLEFEYIIVNDTFDIALADLRSVVRAARLSRERWRVDHPGFLDEFS